MTGEVKKWPVKRHFWPVIVRWPAVILSPDFVSSELHFCLRRLGDQHIHGDSCEPCWTVGTLQSRKDGVEQHSWTEQRQRSCKLKYERSLFSKIWSCYHCINVYFDVGIILQAVRHIESTKKLNIQVFGDIQSFQGKSSWYWLVWEAIIKKELKIPRSQNTLKLLKNLAIASFFNTLLGVLILYW